MSTAVADHTPASPSHASSAQGDPRYKLSFGGILKSEFLKFRTLTSSWVLVILTFLLMVGFAGLSAWGYSTLVSSDLDSLPAEVQSDASIGEGIRDTYREMVMSTPAAGVVLAVLILGSLAAVVGASEFGTKSVISTFSAAPRRGQVYLAKTVVVSVYAAALGLVSGLVGWLLAQPILAGVDLQYSLFREETWLNLLAIVVAFVLTTWMGIGFGGLLRNNAAAIVITVALLFVLPIIVMIFGSFAEWINDLTPYLPWNLTQTLTTVSESAQGPRHVGAALWYLLWCAVPLVAGWFSFVRRDPK